MKTIIISIITYAILSLIVWCMTATIYEDGITIQNQAETIALQDVKIRKYEKTPQWLIDAYDKCSSDSVEEKFLRDCIAFEIKELHH